jgi:ribosome maturation factor RimP
VGQASVGLGPTLFIDYTRFPKEVSVVPDRLESIQSVVEPVVAPLGLQVYDVVLAGGILRLILDRPGGVDIDTLEEASRRVAPAVEEAASFSGSYTLEVSSPGLERPLRRPEHYTNAIDALVTIKARGDDGAMERLRGVITAVDADGVTIRTDEGDRQIRFDGIESAKTVFDWSPAPKPGKGSKPGRARKEAHA